MVENSVGELLKSKTPVEAAKIKIVDPACGGGMFLLAAYQFLLDWHENHFGKLTLAKRRKILTDNIFGVDIDPLVVEITKYCLAIAGGAMNRIEVAGVFDVCPPTWVQPIR